MVLWGQMALQIHSDASYLSASKSRSRVGGHFYLGNYSTSPHPDMHNGAVLTVANILKPIMSSAAEAEWDDLLFNLPRSQPTKLLQSASQTTRYNNGDPKPWRCASIGSGIALHKNISSSSGTPEAPTSATTIPRTSLEKTISLSGPSTYTSLPTDALFHNQPLLVCEGVLIRPCGWTDRLQ
jgi:hypothetical protein